MGPQGRHPGAHVEHFVSHRREIRTLAYLVALAAALFIAALKSKGLL